MTSPRARRVEDGPTREQIQRIIDAISEQLKGHLPNIERALLVADRADLRMKLLDMED